MNISDGLAALRWSRERACAMKETQRDPQVAEGLGWATGALGRDMKKKSERRNLAKKRDSKPVRDDTDEADSHRPHDGSNIP